MTEGQPRSLAFGCNEVFNTLTGYISQTGYFGGFKKSLEYALVWFIRNAALAVEALIEMFIFGLPKRCNLAFFLFGQFVQAVEQYVLVSASPDSFLPPKPVKGLIYFSTKSAIFFLGKIRNAAGRIDVLPLLLLLMQAQKLPAFFNHSRDFPGQMNANPAAWQLPVWS